MATKLHDIRFPNEPPAYRRARDRLLRAEMDLRDCIEGVAALRRKLPVGGRVAHDYAFTEGPSKSVRLSRLFSPGKDTLVVYSFMYGPQMKRACPMCTSFLDGLDGNAHQIARRVDLVVVAKSPIARLQAFARSRNWKRLRLLSSAGTTYNRDYHGESAEGKQWSNLNVFVRRGGKVHHSYSTEMAFAKDNAGQDSRHVDIAWPLWNILDMTPGGRGADWYPGLDD